MFKRIPLVLTCALAVLAFPASSFGAKVIPQLRAG